MSDQPSKDETERALGKWPKGNRMGMCDLWSRVLEPVTGYNKTVWRAIPMEVVAKDYQANNFNGMENNINKDHE